MPPQVFDTLDDLGEPATPSRTDDLLKRKQDQLAEENRFKVCYAVLAEQLARDGGRITRPALFWLDGRRAPAALVPGRYGLRWNLLTVEGEPTEKYVDGIPPQLLEDCVHYLPLGRDEETLRSANAKRRLALRRKRYRLKTLGFVQKTESVRAEVRIIRDPLTKGFTRTLATRVEVVALDGGCPKLAVWNQSPTATTVAHGSKTDVGGSGIAAFLRTCGKCSSVRDQEGVKLECPVCRSTVHRDNPACKRFS